MSWFVHLGSLSLLLLCAPALAGAEGRYRAQEGPDVAAELLLRPDGSFAYALAAGALDEASQGTWRDANGTIVLTTEPRPVPPHFETATTEPGADTPFLSVTWPNGRGIAGIDFRLACADGTTVESYTQYDGWNPDGAPCATPQWIELQEPIHAIQSPRYPIPAGVTALHFVLIPNDLGHVDLTGATATLDGDALILTRTDGTIRFRRTER